MQSLLVAHAGWKTVQVLLLCQSASEACVRVCSSGKAYLIWKEANSWGHLNKSCSCTLLIGCVCQKRTCTSKSGFMQQEHFCVYASWLWLLDNIISGNSVNVLVISLAAGITLIPRYSWLVVWYVALHFIDFVSTKLPYQCVLWWGVSFGCFRGWWGKEVIRSTLESYTVWDDLIFFLLEVPASLTVLQFTFICSYSLNRGFFYSTKNYFITIKSVS